MDELVFKISFCGSNKAGCNNNQLYFKCSKWFPYNVQFSLISIFIFKHFVRFLDIVVEYKVEGKEAVKKTYVMNGMT